MSFRVSLMLMFLSLAVISVSAQTKVATVTKDSVLAHGKYLVERAAPCSDCHTPRDEHGEFVKGKWLQGAPILFKPTVPIPDWADFALPIAGLRGWKDADAIKFLMTGLDPQGQHRRPPMPPFRFNRSDATAIVKYLRSLPPPGAGPAK